MQDLHINYLLAVAIAIIIYYLGLFLKAHSRFLRDFYIPAPVAGGLVFALVNYAIHEVGQINLIFDNSMMRLFMTIFFTSIGFGAKISTVRKGSTRLLKLGLFCGLLVLCQNGISIMIAKLFQLPALMGLAVGSIPLVGGHGSSGVFGPMIEQCGVQGAAASSLAMATFGLVMGGLLGGPLGGMLIRTHNLHAEECENEVDPNHEHEDMEKMSHSFESTVNLMMKALAMLLLATGLGSIGSDIGKHFNMVLPPYLGSILLAFIIRNVTPENPKALLYVPMKEVQILAELALNIFLAMALMNLSLWQLVGLAGPLMAIAVAQVIFLAIFTYLLVFKAMGSNYEAAVTVAAICGFCLGALPTGIANMNALTSKFGPAPMAYLLIPLASSVADCFNGSSAIILINLLK